MIAIVNIGAIDDENAKDPQGWRNYEVRINYKKICTFQHKRSNGLARCLFEAANAVNNKSVITEERMDTGL
jgi:hypothetical protein